MPRHPSPAEHALEVWAAWAWDRREYGWPAESSEVRAMWAAQAASKTPGRDNSVRQGVGIPCCKETRQRPIPTPPRIETARLAPRVHRLLLDMAETGFADESMVIQAAALWPRLTVAELARGLGVVTRDGNPAISRLARLKRRGMARFEELWSMRSLEERRAIAHVNGSTWNNSP